MSGCGQYLFFQLNDPLVIYPAIEATLARTQLYQRSNTVALSDHLDTPFKKLKYTALKKKLDHYELGDDITVEVLLDLAVDAEQTVNNLGIFDPACQHFMGLYSDYMSMAQEVEYIMTAK